MQSLLGAGANPNALYTIPETKTTVSPLTWAITCSQNITDNAKYGFPTLSIEYLLDAGADPLIFGKDKPASALFQMPEELKKCNKPGTCKPEDVQGKVDALFDDFDSSWDTAWWRNVWVAQEGWYVDYSGQWKKKPADFVLEGRPWLTRGKDYICEKAREGVKGELQRRAEEAEEQQYKEKYPLHIAVAANDLATVKKLLENGKYDVNGKDDRGLTALQVAMTCDIKRSGWTCWPRIEDNMAEYLISKGAKVNLMAPVSGADQITKGTYTLLHEAAFRGLTTLVKLFIKAGADVNAVYYSPARQQEFTPLGSAARCDFRLSTGDGPGADSTNSTIKALLDAGANPLPFGPNKPTTANMSSHLGGDRLSKECSTKVGACKEGEVKELVDKWKSSSHSGSCPDSWFELWKAQEKAAATKSGGRRLLKLNT
jgi:ankyrin repeat protein